MNFPKVLAIVVHLCMYPYIDNQYDKEQPNPPQKYSRCTSVYFEPIFNPYTCKESYDATFYFDDDTKYVYWSPPDTPLNDERFPYLWRCAGRNWWIIQHRLSRMEYKPFHDPNQDWDEDFNDMADEGDCDD